MAPAQNGPQVRSLDQRAVSFEEWAARSAGPPNSQFQFLGRRFEDDEVADESVGFVAALSAAGVAWSDMLAVVPAASVDPR